MHTNGIMDMELLALMLENYKRLYIEDMRRQQASEYSTQYVVENDIEPAIAWAERCAEVHAEVARQFAD